MEDRSLSVGALKITEEAAASFGMPVAHRIKLWFTSIGHIWPTEATLFLLVPQLTDGSYIGRQKWWIFLLCFVFLDITGKKIPALTLKRGSGLRFYNTLKIDGLMIKHFICFLKHPVKHVINLFSLFFCSCCRVVCGFPMMVA